MTEIIKFKDSPLKMLLTAPTNSPYLTTTTTSILTTQPTTTLSNLSQMNEIIDDGQTKLITYYNHFSVSGDKEFDYIFMDHNYARAWNWRPETSYIRPTKTLFMTKNYAKANPTMTLQKSIEEKDIVDVESVSPPPTPIYDVEKAKNIFEECEKYAFMAKPDNVDDWEDAVPRTNWTSSQDCLFTSMVKILNSDRMARLTYAGHWNEPILRRTIIDKSVQRVRSLMASINWDSKLTQWLNGLLLDYLSAPFLAVYLDILQSLKTKLPQFVEKMMFGPNAIYRVGPMSNENLFPLLKKSWDPVGSGLILDKPKKLPGNPIFIVTPPFTSATGVQSKYLHKWIKLLSTLAHVITVHTNLGHTCLRMNMINCADHLFNATRVKLQEVRNDCPGRPIVLVGFNTGSAVVCQVAEIEHAVAVVCLGFPLLTAEGKRGDPDDYLLELMYPVLFVIGQKSHRTSREEMEDLRHRMKIETGLVVVGSADDYLRVNKNKRRSEGITQSIVDRCILDEIGDFVGSILLSPYPPVTRPTFTTEQYANSKLMKNRIRSNSNCSSLESEPPSPQPKVATRPATFPQPGGPLSSGLIVGRPPGSGKKKLNLQGNPPSSSPTNLTPIPDPSENPVTLPSPSETPSGHAAYMTKPEILRASHSSDALNRAVQSITPTSNTIQGVVTSRSLVTTGSTLSTLLQSGVRPTGQIINTKPITTSANSGVKILENITVSSSMTQKLLSNNRPMTIYNPVVAGRTTNLGNVVVLPDGTKYIRSTATLPAVRTVGGASTVLPIINRNSSGQLSKQINSNVAKMVPSRRQVITKPRTQDSSLPPPANLTTADIMDLPIIFADDTLVHENRSITSEEQQQPQIKTTQSQVKISSKPKQVSTNKLVVINKQNTSQSLTIPTTTHQNLLKRSATSTSQRSSQPVKFAKIIVSKRANEEQKSSLVAINQQQQKSPKKFDPNSFENFDLETELKATTVPKPNTAILNAQLNKNKSETKPSIIANKKSTISVGGQMTNVTLRVPVTFSKAVTNCGPSRFLYSDSNKNDTSSPTHVVLNRTVTSNKESTKTINAENFTFRYENITKDSKTEPSDEK